MKLQGLALLEGADRLRKAEAAAIASVGRLGIAADEAGRVVAAIASAVAVAGGDDEAVLLSIGTPAGMPDHVVAHLRSPGGGSRGAEAYAGLADVVTVRVLPDGFVIIELCWKVRETILAASPEVEGEAAGHAMQALSAMERALLAEVKARRAMEELLSVVTHALRNPIGSMASASDLIQMAPGDPATLEAATGILARSSRAALRLIADVEQLNQIDSGTLQLASLELRPSLIADSAVEIARPIAVRRKVDLRTEKDGIQSVIMGDLDRLIQAIGNLVVSAVEHSPDGGTVTLRMRAGDGGVVFDVEDQGPHVSPEALPDLFDRLRQTGPRRRSAGAFALAVARELVEAHSGTIACESVPGGVTIMRVTLPGP